MKFVRVFISGANCWQGSYPPETPIAAAQSPVQLRCCVLCATCTKIRGMIGTIAGTGHSCRRVKQGRFFVDQIQPILVVEDEALIRMNLIDVLGDGGFTVHESVDGDTAVAEIDSCEVLHGLVTDVRLGSEIDGWGVARHARMKFPSIAVVYVTADSANAWSSEGVPNSVVLQKPFADAQLLDAVTSLLREAGPQPLA